MKNALTITLLVFSFAWLSPVSAQKAKTLTPIEFSDKMSDITDSLYQKGSAWGTHYNTAASSGNYASLTPYRKEIEAFVSRSIKNLKSMPDVRNSLALRNAMIHFLEFEQKMVREGFVPIEKLSANATQEEQKKALEKVSNMAKLEEGELKKVADEQDAYAKTNGFRIESKAGAGDEE